MLLPELTLKEVEILRLQPDDIVLIQCTRPLTEMIRSSIYDEAKAQFPNHKVIVTSPGIKTSIIRPDQPFPSESTQAHV